MSIGTTGRNNSQRRWQLSRRSERTTSLHGTTGEKIRKWVSRPNPKTRPDLVSRGSHLVRVNRKPKASPRGRNSLLRSTNQPIVSIVSVFSFAQYHFVLYCFHSTPMGEWRNLKSFKPHLVPSQSSKEACECIRLYRHD